MFSAALTYAPTINTIGIAAVSIAVPITLASGGNMNAGIRAALIIAVMGIAGNVFSAFLISNNPMINAAGGFAFGFFVEYSTNNKFVGAVGNGIIWSAILATPTANLIVNNIARLGTRSYIYLSSILIEVPAH